MGGVRVAPGQCSMSRILGYPPLRIGMRRIFDVKNGAYRVGDYHPVE